MPKPTCGHQDIRNDSTATTVIGVTGGIASAAGTAYTIYGKIAGIVAAGGAGATALFVGAAILAAVVTWTAIFIIYYKRCLENPDGATECSAGVINEIVPAFNSTSDDIFPFSAEHDRVDVVIKSAYWPLVTMGGPSFVKCADDPNNSPIIQCFYHNNQVCAAGAGAAIGGVAGAVAGVIVAAIAAAAIGCATIILCIFALIVAVLIAAAAVIIGAIIGGDIGRAASSAPGPTSGSEDAPGTTLTVGDYVTTKGNLIISGDFDGAVVYWFVENTTLHGHSTMSAPFSYTDPDANLQPDACTR